MSLLDLQRRFQARLLAAAGEGPDGGAAPPRGLLVYQKAYRATLKQCLCETFEKTRLWLGPRDFDAAAEAYVAETPSRSFTLAAYGEGFDARLGARWSKDPEVGELAWLDGALRRAFDAADAPPLGLEDLSIAAVAEGTLLFQPALEIRIHESNALEIWRALDAGAAPPAARRLADPLGARVWRRGLSPVFAPIPSAEAAALARMLQGAAFAEACEAFAREAEPAAAAAAALSAWIAEGLIVGVRA
jgi:hypothetical protein